MFDRGSLNMMLITRWFTIPLGLMLVLSPGLAALGQPLMIAPNSQPIQVSGMSGGDKQDASCAGFIAASPNHVISVTEDADLEFELQSSGQPTLLIQSATGQSFCVPADNYSQGKIKIPGRWPKGTYSVFVGDRGNEHHAYTLVISNS